MNKIVAPNEAAQELLARRKARTSLAAYIEYVSGREVPFHIQILCKKLHECMERKVKRLLVCLPPGHMKSWTVSHHLPAFYLSLFPDHNVLAATHTEAFSETWGRKVRNLMMGDEHRILFPGVTISDDSRAAARWDTTKGGTYFTTGVGGAIAGKRADAVILDDLVRSLEDAESANIRDSMWNWYGADLMTRMKPGAIVIFIMCMVGDTPVLMEDGTERPLKDIRPGDKIATYENGSLSVSRVMNWKNQGPDLVYEIKMISGITVRANERHPFLVKTNGEPEWRKLKNLRPGDTIIRATRPREPGRGRPVKLQGANGQYHARDSACPITTKTGGIEALDRNHAAALSAEIFVSNIDMDLSAGNTTVSSWSRMENVPSAGIHQELAHHPIGPTNSASITVTPLEKSEDYSATPVTWSSVQEELKQSFSQRLNTFEIGHDEIVSIESVGIEDVFDIQVERTENFIANGLVSHNTRWHLDDLAGRLIAAEQQGGEKWEKLILPAIANEKDPLGRKPGAALWPDVYDLKMLENIKAQPAMTSRQWSSLYQQNPVPEDGSIIRKSWFKPWKQQDPPKCDYILQSWDTAVSNKSTSAYSACTTWGVFSEPETNLPAMILLSATRGRWLYPDLRKMAQRMSFNYMDDKFDRPMLRPTRRAPDQILVEDRSSGSQLIADLMRAGISVVKVNPSRHGSKDARLMLASDILENGRVYVPYAPPLFTMPYRWSDDFVTELSSFPAAASRDYADSYSQAVDRVKQIGVVRNSDDPWEESIPRQPAREAYY